jgi:hypothetical protein
VCSEGLEPAGHSDAGPDFDSGRGLMIVDALSADWGAYREADGKVVWAPVARNGPDVIPLTLLPRATAP